jgi:hypothetical protein
VFALNSNLGLPPPHFTDYLSSPVTCFLSFPFSFYRHTFCHIFLLCGTFYFILQQIDSFLVESHNLRVHLYELLERIINVFDGICTTLNESRQAIHDTNALSR